MFYEFENITYTSSSDNVTITDNTDLSIDGESKKFNWFNAENESVTISFDPVNLGDYEEITFYLYQKDNISNDNIFSISVDTKTIEYERLTRGWNHVLIDCSSMGEVNEIIFTALTSNLVLFFDYIGYRKVTHDRDTDLINAIKNHISLDYGVVTKLQSDVAAGDISISLTSKSYIYDTSVLQLDNGAGIIEEVELFDSDGTLKEELENSFSAGDLVHVICPTRGEDQDDMEPDPVCGITVYDREVVKENVLVKTADGFKKKTITNILGIMVYIDCHSKKKVLSMASEFEEKYGERFQFLLDGERVDIYLDSDLFTDSVIGNNPRMAYYYKVSPQPLAKENSIPVDDITLTVDSDTT